MQLIQDRLLFSEVIKLYNMHMSRGTRLSLPDVSQALHAVVTSYTSAKTRVFVLVDALDEHPEDIRDKLLAELCKLQPGVYLVVTACPHVVPQLPGAVRVEILAKNEDVRSYVEARIVAG